MAKLAKGCYPGHWDYKNYEQYAVYETRTKAMLDAIPEKVRFPVADGYAFYAVISRKPLTLQFIPYQDAWEIPDAYVRGLRLQDVDNLLNRESVIKGLFSKV
jgi:hypothetical protein